MLYVGGISTRNKRIYKAYIHRQRVDTEIPAMPRRSGVLQGANGMKQRVLGV